MKEVDLNYKIWLGSLKISNNIKVEHFKSIRK